MSRLESLASDIPATVNGQSDITISVGGKELTVSLYETPDITEDDAKQIIEMYAEQLSESISGREINSLKYTCGVSNRKDDKINISICRT